MLRKSAPVFAPIARENIDTTSGVIKNVVIINSGEDKIGDNIDEVFLSQIVEQGNAQSQGVKCRFGHPNLCDDALGTFVGRYKNFRLSAGTSNWSAIADLFLDPVAKNSPKGNLHDYILQFAQTNDDMFGNSIVFRQDESEIKKMEDGTEKEFMRLKSFVASDLVDSPAATNSLFKSDDDFAAKATEFLNENEEIYERLSANPKIFAEFLIKYSNYKSLKNKAMSETKSDSIISEIRKGFAEFKEKHFGKKEKIKAILDVTTADGTILHVDDSDDSGSAAVGDGVTVDGGGSPDGSYVMPDGGTIVVADGVIKEIVAMTETPPAQNEPALSEQTTIEMKAENEKLIAALKEKEEELKAKSQEVETLTKSLEEFQKEFKEFKDTVHSSYKPDERKQQFRKPSGEMSEEENRVEAAKERRKMYKNNTSKIHS